MVKLIVEVERKDPVGLSCEYTTTGRINGMEYTGEVVKENMIDWLVDEESAKKACNDKLTASYRTVLEKLYEAE